MKKILLFSFILTLFLPASVRATRTIIDDQFQRGPTSVGSGANSTTGVGQPAPTGPASSPWIDVTGNLYSISAGNNLVDAGSGVLRRPYTEAFLDITGRMYGCNAGSFFAFRLRASAIAGGYGPNIDMSGATANVAIAAGAGYIGSTGHFAVVTGHTYTIEFTLSGSNHTTYSMVITDEQTSLAVFTISPTVDTTDADSQIAGSFLYVAVDSACSVSRIVVTTEDPTGDTIAITDTNFYCAPYIWQSVGSGSLQANNVKSGATSIVSDANGAYFKTGFNGTLFAVTAAAGSGRLTVSVDNAPYVNYTIGTGQNILTTGLSAGSHTIHCVLSSGAIEISSLQVSSGATLEACSGAIAIRPGNMIIYSDSIGAGNAVGGLPNDADHQLAEKTWIPPFAAAMGCEYGAICYSGQGYATAGSAFDTLLNAYDKHTTSITRLVSGVLSPSPNYVICQHGNNGSTSSGNVTTMISNFQTVAPSAIIGIAIPFGQYAAATITSAVAGTGARLIDPGTEASIGLTSGSTANANSADGTHPLEVRSALLSSVMVKVLASSGSAASAIAY